VKGSLEEMHKDEMAFIDTVRVGRSLLAATSKELATDQAPVDVRTRFKRDRARGLEIKVKNGSIDGIQIRTGSRWIFFGLSLL
jgi:hypothetical protein